MSKLLWILPLCFYFALGSLTLQVEPKTTDCFYIDLDPGQNVKVIFHVTRGGLLDIDLRVSDPHGASLFAGMQFESSVYEFTSRSAGPYSICWNNEMSRWTAKVIQFEVEVDGRPATESKPSKDDLVTPGVLTPFENSIRMIESHLNMIQDDQLYLRTREQIHRDTAESTNRRVFWYSVIESVVLVGISLGQVYYLRKFFETRRPV